MTAPALTVTIRHVGGAWVLSRRWASGAVTYAADVADVTMRPIWRGVWSPPPRLALTGGHGGMRSSWNAGPASTVARRPKPDEPPRLELHRPRPNPLAGDADDPSERANVSHSVRTLASESRGWQPKERLPEHRPQCPCERCQLAHLASQHLWRRAGRTDACPPTCSWPRLAVFDADEQAWHMLRRPPEYAMTTQENWRLSLLTGYWLAQAMVDCTIAYGFYRRLAPLAPEALVRAAAERVCADRFASQSRARQDKSAGQNAGRPEQVLAARIYTGGVSGAEAARVLAITPRHLRRLAASGRVPYSWDDGASQPRRLFDLAWLVEHAPWTALEPIVTTAEAVAEAGAVADSIDA